MASSVAGTDKFLQLVPIFSPRPTMSGIFHKFGSISTLAAPRRKPMETKFVSWWKTIIDCPWINIFTTMFGRHPEMLIRPPLPKPEARHCDTLHKSTPLLYNGGSQAILPNDRDLRPLSEDCLCVWGPMMPVAQSVASKFSKLYSSKIMQRRVASWCAFCDLNPGPTPFNCWDQEVSQMWFFTHSTPNSP